MLRTMCSSHVVTYQESQFFIVLFVDVFFVFDVAVVALQSSLRSPLLFRIAVVHAAGYDAVLQARRIPIDALAIH